VEEVEEISGGHKNIGGNICHYYLSVCTGQLWRSSSDGGFLSLTGIVVVMCVPRNT